MSHFGLESSPLSCSPPVRRRNPGLSKTINLDALSSFLPHSRAINLDAPPLVIESEVERTRALERLREVRDWVGVASPEEAQGGKLGSLGSGEDGGSTGSKTAIIKLVWVMMS